MEADGRVGGLGRLGRHWGPVVCISRDWVKMGVRVHWEPWACLVMSLGSHCRENFIDGPGWGVVGALVSGARTVLGGWVLLVWAVGVLGGWDGAGLVGLLGDGPAASIPVPCVGHRP